jgi:ERCC4-related helicase
VVSPTASRLELLEFIHRPELVQRHYSKTPDTVSKSSYSKELLSLEKLALQYYDYDINRDPYFLSLKDPLERQKVLLKRKTYCHDQLKSLHMTVETLRNDLGISASHWFLTACTTRFLDNQDDQATMIDNVDEKSHLKSILGELRPYLQNTGPFANDIESVRNYSAKVEKLIQTLISEWKPKFTGIIFAEQRAVVQTLVKILSTHPNTTEHFRVGGFVGMSTYNSKKTQISELTNPGQQDTILEDFKVGNINLLITTSVLEEGIDIPQCHIVICFDKPKDLTSYIQRRGRARMKESKYVMILPLGDFSKQKDWKQLESQMEVAYLDQQRDSQEAQRRELEPEARQREFKT